jgi:hypothetical protein
MDFFKSPVNGSMTTSLVILTGLLLFSFILATSLRESALLTKEKSS